MEKRIWKFELVTTDDQKIQMPKGAVLLTLQVQNNIPCLWVLVDPNESEKESRYFSTFGTGHYMDDSIPRNYVGTYQIKVVNSILVFHVFEKLK